MATKATRVGNLASKPYSANRGRSFAGSGLVLRSCAGVAVACGGLLVAGLLAACGGQDEPAQSVAPVSGSTAGNTSQATGGSIGTNGGAPAASAGTSAGGTGNGNPGAGGSDATAGGTDSGGAPAAAGGSENAAGMAGDAAGAAGAAGGNGLDENGDTLPWRPLNVTAPPQNYIHDFNPSDADPEANQQNGTQLGLLDTRAPKLMGKLMVNLGYNGGGNFGWIAQRGFHVLSVDFMGVNDPGFPVIVGVDADFYGKVRLEALEGSDQVPDIDINVHDSVEGHVTYGLKYLHQEFPEEDWGYYLNEDGTVRWSDVGIVGLSHGATSGPRFAKVRRLWRVISLSGPRDNTCGNDPECGNGVIATWLSEPSLTPIERYYSLSGTGDSQYPEIMYAINAMGYLGEPVNVENAAPPYGDSRRLFNNGGHAQFCGEGAQWDDACNYMFGVPPENQ